MRQGFNRPTDIMRIILDSRQSRFQSSELQEHSIEHSESADHGHNHRHWQNHRKPFVDQHIDREIGLAVRHIHLVDRGTGLEFVGESVLLTEVLEEASHHIEGSKLMESLGIQKLVQLAGCILAESHRSQLGRVPCLYPTRKKYVSP